VTITNLESPSAQELADIRLLLNEYAQSLGVDLCFQSFEAELAALPGDYGAPRGALLLANMNGEPAGCCALRPLDSADYPNACEMKRLFVRPACRGLGLGRRLTESIPDAAVLLGYDHILLDTLDDMESARALYAELGFEESPPYYYNPIPGAHYLMARL
jgi:ribosomal protein S18 acetylase RimI-like enzyme